MNCVWSSGIPDMLWSTTSWKCQPFKISLHHLCFDSVFFDILGPAQQKVCTSVKTNPYILAGFLRLAKSGVCVLLQSKTFSLHGNASAGSWELGFPSLLQHPPIKFTWVCTQARSRINMLLDFLELSVCAFGSSFFEICFTKPYYLLLLAFVFGKGRFCFHDFYGNSWKV